MKQPELLARGLVVALVLVGAGIPLWTSAHTPLIHARMAENGGWSPDTLQAQVGQSLHLRFTSDDVVHGFGVGQMDMQPVDIEPGKVSDVALNFSRPGRYTFYCTHWCGINHWRMRGTIEVRGGAPASESLTPPLYVQLGLDLDAPREAPSVPLHSPSAGDAREVVSGISISKFTGVDFYRSHSPYQAWAELRREPALAELDDQRIWDLVAYIWQSHSSAQDIADGQKLFAQNCAACHGETGGGNGVFADALAAQSTGQAGMLQRPANFTDSKRMLGASPALLEGKILRGGMGTGMPSWGPIFTEAQVQKLVGYLYTFVFRRAEHE